jgi:hypothetical protein
LAVIERKSLKNIALGDRLVENIGRFLKAGLPLDEKGMEFLKSHKVKWASTISLTHQERQELPDPTKETEEVQSLIYQAGSVLLELREELFDQVEPIFKIFSEKDKVFETRGKTKQIKEGDLLKPKLDQIVQGDADNGSQAILPPGRVKGIMHTLAEIYDRLNTGGGYRGPETLTRKNLLPRNSFGSVRTRPVVIGGRIDQPGTALAWHAVDTAIYFMTALLNMNKKRHLLGLPYSQMRFDVDSSFGAATVFRYKDEYLIEAAMGAVLHPLGYCHESIFPLLSEGEGIDVLTAGPDDYKLIRKNVNVVRNLLRERRDISALGRMIAGAQAEFPDGTGYPKSKEGKIPHEFVRLFHIIDLYDSLANPYLYSNAMNRQDILEYLEFKSGEFPPDLVEFPTPYRFDQEMVEEFLWVVAPYNVGEIVQICPKSRPDQADFIGQVYAYFDSPIPMVSILKDIRTGQDYNFGKMIWNLATKQIFLMEGNNIKKKTIASWLSEYKIVDLSLEAQSMDSYKDQLYGQYRNAAWDPGE